MEIFNLGYLTTATDKEIEQMFGLNAIGNMQGKKYLAYISPLEDINNKEYVLCRVTFITGDLNHKTMNYRITTSIFRYYYYGSAFEVIELDNSYNIVDIHDIRKDDMSTFGLSLRSIVTLNNKTFDMMASNDITYNLKVNKFYNYCKQTVENIYNRIQEIDNFVLRVFIKDNVVIYIQLEEEHNNSKYSLNKGFIVADKSKLKQVRSDTSHLPEFDINEKLKQSDIDKIVTRLIG